MHQLQVMPQTVQCYCMYWLWLRRDGILGWGSYSKDRGLIVALVKLSVREVKVCVAQSLHDTYIHILLSNNTARIAQRICKTSQLSRFPWIAFRHYMTVAPLLHLGTTGSTPPLEYVKCFVQQVCHWWSCCVKHSSRLLTTRGEGGGGEEGKYMNEYVFIL